MDSNTEAADFGQSRIHDEINRRLGDAITRSDKRAVLLDYMHEDEAEHTLGLIMGDRTSDVREVE